ncbi:MAG: DHH family phosphoesterase, partial [Anaerococcus sp.]|nr:DHH family phosphoesterase [Anaerococcus sp.]
MKDNKKSRYEYIVYVMILPVLTSILLFYYNQMLGAIAILSCGLLYFYLQKQLDYNEKAIQRYVDEVDLSFDSITKNLVFEMPFPIAVLNNGRDIKWHNGYFRNLFPQEDLVGVDIRNLAADFKDIDFTDKQVVQPINIPIDGKIMQFYFTSVFNEGLKTTETFLYGLDNTYDESIKQLFKDKRLVFFTVFLDNYEDLRNSTDSLNRPQVLGSIDRTITEYFKRYNGVVRKYENDRFMVVMEYQQYKKIHDNKFSILDDVRDIDFGNTINPTLSIGVGISGANPNEIYDDSRVAIDIALSRGGDQAVVKLEDNYEYFGGKSKATEKTSK